MPELPVVLLAEDSEDDVIILRKAMSQASIDFPLFVAKDGEEAIAYLKGAGKYGNRSEFPMPDLLLLDLVMPLINGFEVLEWIRELQCAARNDCAAVQDLRTLAESAKSSDGDGTR